jgi:hypothetical protein
MYTKVRKIESPIIAAITFLKLYLIRSSRKPVKTSRITIKINGFSIEAGSSNAVIPAAWTGSEIRIDPISTARSRSGITRKGIMRFISMMRLFVK